MNKQDNFEDNLYLILMRIKLIRDTLLLNTNPELFFAKILEDIDFVDQILGILLKRLQENLQRIDREGLLEHLFEIERQFSKVLWKIVDDSSGIFTQEIPALGDRISILQKASLERQETAETLSAAMGNYQEEPVISSDELNELLKDF